MGKRKKKTAKYWKVAKRIFFSLGKNILLTSALSINKTGSLLLLLVLSVTRLPDLIKKRLEIEVFASIATQSDRIKSITTTRARLESLG